MNTLFISAYIQEEKKSLFSYFSSLNKKIVQITRLQEKKILKTKFMKRIKFLFEKLEVFLFLVIPKIRAFFKQLNMIFHLESFFKDLKIYLAKNILQSLSMGVFVFYIILVFI